MPGYASFVYSTLGRAYRQIKAWKAAQGRVRGCWHFAVAACCRQEREARAVAALGRVSMRMIRVAEVAVRHTLPRRVVHLLCNRQVLRVVLDRRGKVPALPRMK
jgi:hypothetical protein